MSKPRFFSRSTPILRGRSKNLHPPSPYVQGSLFAPGQECEASPGRSEALPGRSEVSPGSTKKTRTVRRQKPSQVGDAVAPYLQIESTPLGERIVPSRHTYILVIQPDGVRAAGGEYSAQEAHEIARATRGWDWEDARSIARLEVLLDSIIRRLARGGVA